MQILFNYLKLLVNSVNNVKIWRIHEEFNTYEFLEYIYLCNVEKQVTQNRFTQWYLSKMGKNNPIFEECQTWTTTGSALSCQWARQDDSIDTPQPKYM